ncbi:MAG: penicillin-binding transpeptidase domain-containing protein, partial [Clostridia bacterium]|nr:penicillin-binding transpeptidase domain-containing protein [Clostridia bacterium]
GEDYLLQSTKKITHRFTIEAPRGMIFDRDGNQLAFNRESNDIYLTKAYTTDEELNESLLQLATVFKENGENYLHSFDYYVLGDPLVFNPDRTIDEIIAWQTDPDILNFAAKFAKHSAKELLAALRIEFGINDEYTDEEAYKIICMRYEILKNSWNYRTGGRVLIAMDVSLETIAVISEHRHDIQGLIIQKKMVREYGDVSDLAHVLGYVGNITPEQLADYEEMGYDDKDIIGIDGIEKYAEDYLRGTDGYMEVEADIRTGRIIEQIGGYDEIPGNNVTLTIDTNLQKVAMESLESTIADIIGKADDEINFGDASAGAVVAIDVKTGELLAMASYPTYDPGWFIHDDDESQEKLIEALMGSYGVSTFNRALQGIYTPGSTFKPIIAIAALESDEHDYDAESIIECEGHFEWDGWEYFCHRYIESRGSHGPLTISEGIETSCNIVFHRLGLDIGIDAIDKWVARFGLGQATGIDLYGEAEGIRSNPEFKYARFDEKWWSADTGQTSIGQLYNNFSPLQLAVYVSALANGGEKLTPYLIKEVISPDGEVIYKGEKHYEQIIWSDETFAVIQEGMNSVTLDGTASKVFPDNYPISVAGKTGTAETGREAEESSNGLFICYAPVEDPQIAIVVVIEKGVWGSYAAPVAKKILNAYFGIDERY